jgi:hypothetical protein
VTTEPAWSQALSMSGRTLLCEQLVWSTASRNLVDSGFGPIAQSPGWPSYEAKDRHAGLGTLARFLPEGSTAHIARGLAPPRCFALAQVAEGRLLLAKSYLGKDDNGRPNKYLVHALLDRTCSASVLDLFAAARSGVLLTSLPVDLTVTRHLPQVSVARAVAGPEVRVSVAPAVRREWLRRCASTLLDRERGGPPLVLVSADPELARPVLYDLLAMTPPRVLAGLTVSTYEQDPRSGDFDVVISHPPFLVRAGAGPGAVDLDGVADLSPESATPAGRAMTHLVDGYLEAGAVPDVGRLEELCRAEDDRRLLTEPVGGLRRDEVEHLLRGALAQTWLEQSGALDRVVHEIAHGNRPLAGLVVAQAPGLPPDAGQQLHDALGSQTVAAVTGSEGEADLDGLLRLADDLGLGASVALAVRQAIDDDLAGGGRPEVDLDVVVPLLRRADEVSEAHVSVVARRVFLPGMERIMAREWTTWHDAVIVQHIAAPTEETDEVFRWLLRHQPERWPGAVDEALERQEIAADQLGRLLPWAQPSYLRELVRALCLCTRLPVGFVLMHLLDDASLTAEAVAEVTRTEWPSLARQAGVPAAVADVVQAALVIAYGADDDRGRWRRPFRHRSPRN